MGEGCVGKELLGGGGGEGVIGEGARGLGLAD